MPVRARTISAFAVAALAWAARAESVETASARFAAGAVPEGWTVAEGAYVSPAFGGDVRRIEMAYSAGAVDVFARRPSDGTETLVASAASAAEGLSLVFPEGTGFRSFRISPGDASFSLVSFSASWPTPASGAVPCSRVLGGYSEPFDCLAAKSWSPAEQPWDDGITVPFWQATQNGASASAIKRTYGMGNKSGGLYAFYGTNRTDASYSIAAVANGKNAMMFGFAVTNDTGETAISFEIAFTARQWTFSSARKTDQTLALEYLVTNAFVSIADEGAWTAVPEAAFTTAVTAFDAESEHTDVATGSLRREICAKLRGVELSAGDLLFFRWTPSAVSNGEALGVDDVRLACAHRQRGLAVHLVDAGRR